MMFGELVATVIWFAVPWIWNVEVVRLWIVIEPEPVPVIVITLGDDVETVTVPAPTMEVVAFGKPFIAVMPPGVDVTYPVSFTNCEMEVVVSPMAPVPLIIMQIGR